MAKAARAVKAPPPPATAPDPEPVATIVNTRGVVRKAKNRKTAGKHKGKQKRTEDNPHGRGRPTFVPTEEQRNFVTVCVAGGIEHRHIAAALGISRPTLEKHFRFQIDNAGAQANAKVIASLFKECGTGNVRAIEFWLTNRQSSRWAHKQKVDGHVDMNVQLHDRVARARKKLGGKGGDD